jgi:hypothetical protein
MAVKVRIATGAEMPINRDAGLAGYAGEEGDLVGLDPSTGEVVLADADSLVTIPARGVLATPAKDPSEWASYPEPVQAVADEKYTRVGEHRVTFVSEGAIVENIGDTAFNFTPGGTVYLAPGGGYTQTKPTDVGDLVQVVGYATDDGEGVYVRVDFDHTVA